MYTPDYQVNIYDNFYFMQLLLLYQYNIHNYINSRSQLSLPNCNPIPIYFYCFRG